jgi:hypothetical protein
MPKILTEKVTFPCSSAFGAFDHFLLIDKINQYLENLL